MGSVEFGMTAQSEFLARFVSFRESPGSRVRLFCFPNAGGGVAILHGWFRALPSQIHVCPLQLPGRENRRLEPPFTSLEPLVSAVAEVIADYSDRPFAFFGHSLGGLVAFELARELRRRKKQGPVRLFVSARRAPHLPNTDPPIRSMSEAELIAALSVRYNAIPDAILADRELMAMFLPILRADLGMVDDYVYAEESPLDYPISALGGYQDRAVRETELDAWRIHTASSFSLRMFPGGHFFPKTAGEAFLKAITEDLREFS